MRRFVANFTAGFIPIPKIRRKVREFFMWWHPDLILKKLFVKRTAYDCVFSLGEGCFTAQALKNSRLRKFSGPFDWVGRSTFEKRIEFLTDDFRNFFNKEDFDFVLADHRNGAHSYANKRTGIFHIHDFSAKENFDSEFPAAKEKYERRINRLLNLIKSANRVLAVYVDVKGARYRTDEEVMGLFSKLRNKFGEKMDLFYVRPNDELKPNQGKITYNENGLIIGEYFGYDSWDDEKHRTIEKAFRKLCLFIKVK